VRTIRFYISEGLLPPPQAHGRYSVYDEEYLTRIELIKLLKNAYLPLKEIKRMVESLSKAEIESMLHKLSEPGSPAPLTSPQAPASVPQASPAKVIKEGGLPEALDYISRVLKSQAAPAASRTPPAVPAAPAMPKLVNPPSHPLARARAGLPELEADAGTSLAQPEESPSSWRRYTIQPGVELLVSEQVYHQFAPSISKIVAQVKQLFSTHPSGGKNV
jgi:DNA-binding transcriptional MerR regulator